MDFLRRGRVAGEGDVERHTVELGETESPSPQNEMQQPSTWRIGPLSVRRPMPFTRRSVGDNTIITNNDSESNHNPDDASRHRGGGAGGMGESPKTPRFNLGFSLPPLQLERADTAVPPQADPQRSTHSTAAYSAEAGHLPQLQPTAPVSPVHLASTRWPDAPGPVQPRQVPMDVAGEEEQQQPRRQGRRTRSRFGTPSQPGAQPKRFLFCLPWIASSRVRSLALQCFVSGSLIILTLSVYLALTLSGKIKQSEFTVLLILIILFGAVFFSHRVIRLFLLVHRPQPEGQTGNEAQRLGIFAVPEQPIRVVLARDEEEEPEAGSQAATKPKPPPYGAWRQSVRVDPNRIYWQRNPNAVSNEPVTRAPGTTGAGNTGVSRPPSYASEDGVDYVVEARPRSMAPTAMLEMPLPLPLPLPLPVHPSEAGRLNGRQAPPW